MISDLGYSWIAASAVSPLTIVISIWNIYIFHSFKRKWRTVDLFLVALGCQEMLGSGFIFSFSVVNMINPRIAHICVFILWGLTAVRTLQILTLTSMVLDRALTIKWPYRYRFSVRRNQIRYHITVLATISLFVGVAAIFARHSNSSVCPAVGSSRFYGLPTCCSTYPQSVDIKFSMFIVGLYGFMALTTFIGLLQIVMYRCKSRRHKSVQLPSSTMSRPIPNEVLMPYNYSNSTDKDYSPQIDDTKVFQKISLSRRSASNRPYDPERASSDLRWGSVVVVSSFCFVINHIPYLVLTILSLTIPTFWSEIIENAITWLHLAEALMLPIILWMMDSAYKEAIQGMFTRQGDLSSHEDERRYGCQLEATAMKITNKTDVFATHYPVMDMPMGHMVPNYRRKTDGKRNPKNARKNYKNPLRVDIPCGLPSATNIWLTRRNHPSFLPNVYSIDQSSRSTKQNLYLQSRPSLSRLPSMESDLNKDSSVWDRNDEDSASEDDNHIYATLSEVNFCSHSTLEAQDSLESLDSDRGGDSCTTSANDDFEFHDSRYAPVMTGKGITVITIGNEEEANPRTASPATSSGSRCSSTLELVRQRDSDVDADDEDSLHELVLTLSQEDETEDSGVHNLAFETDSDSGKNVRLQTYKVNKEEFLNNMLHSGETSLKSSLSMNDLDVIGGETKANDGEDDVLVYPVKSESMVSLFNLDFHDGKDHQITDFDRNHQQKSAAQSDLQKPKYNSCVNITQNKQNKNLVSNITEPSSESSRNTLRDPCGRTLPNLNSFVRISKVSRNRSQKRNWKVSVVECNNEPSNNRPQQVLSMKTLLGALKNTNVSYLDTGDVYKHHQNPGQNKYNTYSKTVTVSDYL